MSKDVDYETALAAAAHDDYTNGRVIESWQAIELLRRRVA